MKIAQKCGSPLNSSLSNSVLLLTVLMLLGTIVCSQDTTLFLGVLFKEGLTTPASRDYGFLRGEIYNQYTTRELTLVGQRQMYELGRRIKNQYRNFLKNLTNPEDYTIIALNKSCHKASMVSFNSGFLSDTQEIEFPNHSPSGLVVEYPVSAETLSQINFAQPLPGNQTIFLYNRYVGFKVQKDVVFWDRNIQDECPNFVKMFSEPSPQDLESWISQNSVRVYAAMEHLLRGEMTFVMDDHLWPLNVYDTKLIAAIAEYSGFNQLHNKSSKYRVGNVSFDTLQEVADMIFWNDVGVPNRTRMVMSPLLKFLTEKCEAAIKKEADKPKTKILLASVSDDVLSAVFSAFELPELAKHRQAYGANIILEIFRTQYDDGSSKVFLKFLHNGAPLKIFSTSQDSLNCPAETFVTQATQIIDPQWSLKCGLQVPENLDKVVLNAMNTLLTIFFISTVLVVFYVLYSFRKRSQRKSRNSSSGEKISLGFKITFENNANRESDFNLDIMDNKEKAKVIMN